MELQVWHAENGRRTLFEDFGPRGEKDPSMRLERVSTAKNRFYITLDCDKRLKVQRLVLVAVMRINGQIFVSEDAHFPPPSSKRGASPRLKGRAGPYETLLSFADSLHEDDARSPRSALASSSSSPPLTGRRRANSLRSGSTNSSPRSASSGDVNSWQSLVQWLLGSRHAAGALILQHLAQLSSIAIDFGTHAINSITTPPPLVTPPVITVESIRQELLSWLEGGHLHIMDLLEGGFLHQCIQEPWFLGNISQAGAHAYLHWYCQRANLSSAFLVRFSSPASRVPNATVSFPHLCIEAIWTNEQTGAQERYSAPIVFEMDASGIIYYWIETANDAVPSRSPMLAEVVRYTCNTTGWPSVWRNPPPQISLNLSGVTSSTASGYASPASPSGSPGTSTSTIDGIAFHKPRSMPLLHSPLSRAQPSSTSATLSRNTSAGVVPSIGPARSPMLVLPSRLGILPHDPALHPTDPTSDGSDSTKPAPAFAFQPWAFGSHQQPHSNPSFRRSQDHMDTGSSESNASSVDHDVRPSSSSAMQPDDMPESFTATSNNSFDLPPQDFDYAGSGFSNPSQSSENGMFPSMAFSNMPDAIGMRSLSAPTALRTWAAPPGPMMGFSGPTGDGNAYPPHYLAAHGAGAPQQGARFGLVPSVSFPYSDSHPPLESASHFHFNPALSGPNFGHLAGGNQPQH